MAVVTAGLALGAVGAVMPASTTRTFSAVADASVREDMPGTASGTATTLRSAGSPRAQAFLRFDVAGLRAPVSRALLEVYVTTDTDTGVVARPVAEAWSESGVTWETRPAVGGSGATGQGTWARLDVTPLVHGDGAVDVAVTSPLSNARSLHSREAGATAPRLVVETTPTPTPAWSVTLPAVADSSARGPGRAAFGALPLRVDRLPEGGVVPAVRRAGPARARVPG